MFCELIELEYSEFFSLFQMDLFRFEIEAEIDFSSFIQKKKKI